ncbi:hypothetical protein BpHYR1_015569 [Brachionus plicatilis]|uniref:Uncharacterized protein n=1 Tax=Brachionus plicatilis TaxID=10195 RepID=A0A3M7S5H5_BRAPC|nr:hypothetical protein BpHYR1_015569 [Brachionus plicatilis]
MFGGRLLIYCEGTFIGRLSLITEKSYSLIILSNIMPFSFSPTQPICFVLFFFLKSLNQIFDFNILPFQVDIIVILEMTANVRVSGQLIREEWTKIRIKKLQFLNPNLKLPIFLIPEEIRNYSMNKKNFGVFAELRIGLYKSLQYSTAFKAIFAQLEKNKPFLHFCSIIKNRSISSLFDIYVEIKPLFLNSLKISQ